MICKLYLDKAVLKKTTSKYSKENWIDLYNDCETFQCLLQLYIIIVLKIVFKNVDVRNIKIPHLISREQRFFLGLHEKFLQIGLYCNGKVNLIFLKKESCTPHYFESMQLSQKLVAKRQIFKNWTLKTQF